MSNRAAFWTGVAAILGMLYLGWSVLYPVSAAMSRYENLRLFLFFVGCLYGAQFLSIAFGVHKNWIAMQLAAKMKANPPREQRPIATLPEPVDRNGDSEPGMMNICMEDALAMVPEAARGQVIKAWLLLGTEYAAREMGKAQARDFLSAMQYHVATAQMPWRE